MDRQLTQKEKLLALNYRNGKKKWLISRLILVVFVFLFGSVLAGFFKGYDLNLTNNYDLAPHPIDWKQPVVQVYSARTWGAKKILAVHTWIATKRHGEDHYRISQIIGWRLDRSGTALFSEPGIPDTGWHGNRPTL